MNDMSLAIPLKAQGPTSELPENSPERKAAQVPDPVTYHLVCIVPEVDKTYDSGIIKADKTVMYEEVLTPVLYVLKVGPDAFKDPTRFPSGPSCKKGDFIIVRPNSGTRIKIHGQELRIINDDSVEAVVEDPRGIVRCS